ncbi:MAG: hypothetical protein UW30_C0010G0024 [Candidatus Giovannonibacteria bacterium GW2011_GWA2_44_13b]|uniref:Uncharacterized protein n=1 Tax=Candidatus Giovannonibacteria bacterium GW2011_GWA2_44_13b TaxID=1618647 RepID=A0A0G1H451_9BACT|nr:MAG: hypothetical protein UW30_C0010G0024 [Candidatus Giovannonibacteria bacterium GW2011_GWA2_44_13b]
MIESRRAKLTHQIRAEQQKYLKPFETELGIAGTKDYLEYLQFMLALQKRQEKKIIQEEIDRQAVRIVALEQSPKNVGKYLGELGYRLGLEGFVKPQNAPQVISEIKKYSKMLIELAEKQKTVQDI